MIILVGQEGFETSSSSTEWLKAWLNSHDALARRFSFGDND